MKIRSEDSARAEDLQEGPTESFLYKYLTRPGHHTQVSGDKS